MDSNEGRKQIATINATGAVDTYQQIRESFHAREDPVDAEYAAMLAEAQGEKQTPSGGTNTGATPTGPIQPGFDLEIPQIPGTSANVSREKELREQQRQDELVKEQQLVEANAEPPGMIMTGISNFRKGLADLPGTTMDAVLTMAAPLSAAGQAGLAPIANPSRTGDPMTDFKNNFVTAYEAGKTALSGEFPDEDYGYKIAVERLPELGINVEPGSNTAHILGGAIDILGDPTVVTSLAFLKSVQRGLALKTNKVKAGVKEDSAGNFLTNGLYEILTFGKGIDLAQVKINAQAAGDAPAEVARIVKEAGKAKNISEAKIARVDEAAAKVDADPTPENIRALHDVLNDVPEMGTVAKLMDEDAAAGELAKYHKILGDPEGPAFDADFANVSDATLAKSLTDNDNFIPMKTNVAKLNTVEDADAALDDMMEVHATTFDSLTTNTGMSQEAIAIDQNLQLTNLIGDEVLPQSAREAYAARQILVSSASNLKDLGRASVHATGTKVDYLAFAKALAVHRRMVERYKGRTGEAQKLFDDYNMRGETNRQLSNNANKLATKADRSTELRALVREFISSETDPSIISKIADKSAGARTADMMFEVYVNAILSGPVTHAVNMFSNTLLTAWAPTQNVAEAMAATLRLDFEQGADKIVEAGARVSGIVQGTADALRLASNQASWDELKLDGSHFASGEIARMRLKPSITSANANLAEGSKWGQVVDFIGTAVRLPGAALQAEDKGFKLIHYRGEVNAQAVMAARKSGKGAKDQIALYHTLRHNPTEKMMNDAIKIGELNTFTNELGTVGSMSHELIKKIPTMRYLIPFFATPTNIVTMGLRNSVFGNVFWKQKEGVFGDLKGALTDGGPAGDTARAKIAMGSMIPMAIMAYFSDDRITGRIDQKTAKGRFDAQQNKPPYSIRIGDEWISYEKVEPFRSVVGLYQNWKMAAENMDAYDEEGQPTNEFQELTMAAIMPVIQTIGDQYMLQQLGGILGMLDSLQTDDPEFAKKQFIKMTTSAIPYSGMGRQLNSTTLDGTYRMANTWVEQAMKVIPGLSDNLPARLTVWGDPQIYEQGVGPDIVSPLKTRQVEFDAIDQHLTDLDVKIPGIPKDMIIAIEGDKGIEVKLTTEQQHRLAFIRGKGPQGKTPLKNIFKEVMADEEFLELPDRQQKTVFDSIMTNATKTAKEVLFAEYPDLQKQFEDKLMARVEHDKRTGTANKNRGMQQ